MTPDAAADPLPLPENQIRSAAGMTTRIAKSSLWSLAGQVTPVAVSLATTPFTIRLLGAEGYGVLVLIALLPAFLAFADLGMSMAATKFCSSAFVTDDREKERRTVSTAAILVLCGSLPVVFILIVFAGEIVPAFNVPAIYIQEARLALRIAAVTFVINLIISVAKAPLLARLRTDIVAITTALPRIVAMIAIPFALYLGYGIVGAVSLLFFAGLISLVLYVVILFRFVRVPLTLTFDRAISWSLLGFGVPYAFSTVGGILVTHLEKPVLSAVASVKDLAYYSAAYSFAMLATMFTAAVLESLVPAFSQLHARDGKSELKNLFVRSLKINVIVMLPIVATMGVAARPLLSIWGGADFGEHSTPAFYLLLVGMFFNLTASIPLSVLLAYGRTGLLAKLYWFELVPYIILTLGLTTAFGIKGAAAAWSIRTAVDALIVAFLTHRVSGVSIADINWRPMYLLFGFMLLFLPAVLFPLFADRIYVWLRLTFILFLAAYAYFAWRSLLDPNERNWIVARLNGLRNRFAA